MRIDRLTVKNFKGFAEKTFEFTRSSDALPLDGNGSFHLIIGHNGTGKTSALDALAVAAGSWFLGVSGVESRPIKDHEIRHVVHRFEDTFRIEKLLPVHVEAQGRVEGQIQTWQRTLNTGRTNRIGAKSVVRIAAEMVRRMKYGEAVTLPFITYYGSNRLWQEPRDTHPEDDALSDQFASRLGGYEPRLDPRLSQKDLIRWLQFEQKLSFEEGRESTQSKLVKQAIQAVVENCVDVIYSTRQSALMLNIDGQSWLPFGMLSDGQRNMAAMIGDIAMRIAQLNPHLGENALRKTPGIVLIDELDLHLHPIWQRHVVEDLKGIFPEIQFIATTHSPFIVQAMHEHEIIPLDQSISTEPGMIGIEAIAQGLMGVSRPEVSLQYLEQVEVAKRFLLKLEEMPLLPEEKLKKFEETLAKDLKSFAENPAYQAFLELKFQGKLSALSKNISVDGRKRGD